MAWHPGAIEVMRERRRRREVITYENYKVMRYEFPLPGSLSGDHANMSARQSGRITNNQLYRILHSTVGTLFVKCSER